jgi:FkbM family methyltransferase
MNLATLPAFPAFNRQKACRYGQMLYNVHDMYIGRSLDLYGEYSEGEVELFRQILRPGDFAVEVGANYGAHTVFLAQQVGPTGVVAAFEPQRIVFQTLCANIALNNLPNIIALHEAVGAESGSIKVPVLDYSKTNNFGGLSLGKFEVGEDVPVVTLDSKPLKRCNFLKIDVEGMEEQVLRGAARAIERFKPVMYVENDKPDKSDDLVRYIDSLDYNMYWHKPYYFSPNNFFGNPDNVFPNVISINMLCVHKSIPQTLQGFLQVEVPKPQAAKT